MRNSIITSTDSYKSSHWLQYPFKRGFVSSYIEARYSKMTPHNTGKILFLGINNFVQKYLLNPITLKDINSAENLFKAHGEPFNKEGWLYILERHKGFLPLKIKALLEGTVTSCRMPLVQVENADPAVPWLTSYIETALLRSIWYPTTVGTLSREIKHDILYWLDRSADDAKSEIHFKLHDFGARGASSSETAGIGGAAHLVNFMGTDTVESMMHIMSTYGTGDSFPFGYSIPAAEHSTISSWGKSREKDTYENMLKQFGNGLVAVVSDTYDIWNAVDEIWGKELKDQVLNMNGTLVIRPDSGDPVEVVSVLIQKLDKIFGSTLNTRNYKVLNKVRIIQGDGVNQKTIWQILDKIVNMGYSASNMAFGMGGALLQNVNRDTLGFAMKANAIRGEFDTEWTDIYKNPVTDALKASKSGRVAVVNINGRQTYIREDEILEKEKNLMITYYENGLYTDFPLYRQDTFSEVRNRSNF
jgi:nicotinamide phosphoribosyltransferase